MFTKKIHVFRAGDQTSAQGVQRHFSTKDLDQVVKTYNPDIHEAPLVLGHAGDSDSLPSFGWIKKFERKGDNLYADVAFTDTAKDLVKDGHYRKVSISFYSPDSAINPHQGQWSARHLALLGASPPAVKGLEPFSFAEVKGVYDFAVALSPSEIFDEELGPTMIVEKSPLEMLRERLDAVREDVSSAVQELRGSAANQPVETIEEAATASIMEEPEAAQMANPDAPQYAETKKYVGREGTEIAQQTADLEDQFPEEEFMENGKISRKHAKGAHGQVMQVVENVYEEAHKESTAERKEAADRAFERKRQRREGDYGKAHETEEIMKDEDRRLSRDHKEQGYNARLDESLGDRDGKESGKKQSMKARRDESKGMEKAMGKRPYAHIDKSDHGEWEYKQGYNDRLDESLGDRDGKESGKKQSMKARRDESKAMEKHYGKRPYSHIDKSDHAESDREKARYDRDAEARRQRREGRYGAAHESEELEKLETSHKEGYNARLDESLGARDGKESGKKQSMAARRHESEGMEKASGKRKYAGDKSMDHAEYDYEEDEFGRYETARSASDGYADRMRTGKAGPKGRTGRMETARSSEQARDRMHTAKSAEQARDRMHTGQAGPDGDGFSRWAGQEDGYDQVDNMDQYDAGFDDYPEPNRAELSKGTDPYGRKESQTRIPVETEEGPDDTVFAVQMENVMSDRDMRVLRQKSSDKRPRMVKTHDYLYGEPQADEMTTEDGVTTARKSMNASRTVEHAEYDTEEPDHEADLEDLRYEIGDGRPSKNKLLTPGAQDSLYDPAAITGPDGVYSEIPEGEYKSYKGDPKSKNKILQPGQQDSVTDPAEITGPDGVYKEASLEQLRDQIGDGRPSKARQLQPGAMDDLDTPAEISKRSGGVYAEDHKEQGYDDRDDESIGERDGKESGKKQSMKDRRDESKGMEKAMGKRPYAHIDKSDHGERKDPYTKTGFGSTYDEGEGDDQVMEGEEDYNELSADHCGGMDYGMGSMGQARALGYPQQMYEELQALKAKYAEMERRHREEKIGMRRMQMAEAIGHLYTEGRLTDGVMPEQELLSYVEGLEFGTLEFSEGETAATKLLTLLSKLPPMVSFSEVAGGTFKFAEEADLDPHERALQMVEKGEAADYVEALKQTMFTA